MGWLDSAVSFVSNKISGISGGDVFNAAVSLGGDVLGAKIAGNANQNAAKTVSQGYQAQADSIRAGNDAAQARFDTIIEQGQPATDYLRRVVASDPYQLTPEQRTGREDTARQARNSLAASGLRGAGRAGVAVINNADGQYYDNAVSSNINRADQAASTLSSRANNASMTGAQYDANTGVRVGGTIPEAANAQAGADVANAAMTGSVMGSLSSYIAGDQKDKSRDSRYQNWKKPTV